MLPSIELLVFSLNELDVIVIVINGKIVDWEFEIKACFQQQSYCYVLEDFSVFIVIFPFVVE